MTRVAVFGGSEWVAGDPVYETARRLGSALARAGYEVATGGYGGVMEAACRGAHEAGGATLGITCEIFRERTPNPYLTDELPTCDLHERTRLLVDDSDGFVVLPGKVGTLAELTLVWALDRAGSRKDVPVVLLGAVWEEFLEHLARWDMAERSQLAATRIARDPEEAVAHLRAALPKRT